MPPIPRAPLAALLLLVAAAAADAQTVAPTPAPETAPETWEVTGLGAGETLNLRAGPSTGDEVVAELARGTRVGNLGCQGEGAGKWCRVQVSAGGLEGWAAAHYLAPTEAAAAEPPAATPAAPELPPAGSVACSLAGKPVPTCPLALRRKDDGGIEAIVTFPDGFERLLTLGQGEVTSPDPTDEVAVTAADGVTIVEVNGVERIEIPDAVVPQP